MEVDDGDDDGDDHDAGDHDHDHVDSCGELTIILQSLKVGHNVTCTTESCRRKVASRSLPQKSEHCICVCICICICFCICLSISGSGTLLQKSANILVYCLFLKNSTENVRIGNKIIPN